MRFKLGIHFTEAGSVQVVFDGSILWTSTETFGESFVHVMWPMGGAKPPALVNVTLHDSVGDPLTIPWPSLETERLSDLSIAPQDSISEVGSASILSSSSLVSDLSDTSWILVTGRSGNKCYLKGTLVWSASKTQFLLQAIHVFVV